MTQSTNPDEYPCVGGPMPLLIRHLMDRVLDWAPGGEIVYRDQRVLTYAEMYERVGRLAGVLSGLGVKVGDRVGVLDWDSHRYLEAFFAVPMMGAVLHTVNVRLSPEQVLYTIRHADDRVLLVHADFLPLVAQLAPHLPDLRHVVVMEPVSEGAWAGLPVAGEYEALLGSVTAAHEWPELEESAVATLFYTTGTTGDPKGAFYSHRQIVLHTLTTGLTLSAFHRPYGISDQDVYMPLTPMFHVHAWGVPYVATLLGMKQVYPGRYEPAMLCRLIGEHRVTFSHCVPTILQMIMQQGAAHGVRFEGLKIMTGGAALPKGLALRAMEAGMRIMGGYGMSETCPIVSVSGLKPGMEGLSGEEQVEVTTRTGFPAPLVQAEIWDGEGKALPRGREHSGELVLRAPWLTQGYYRQPERSRDLWAGGWLHTGDIAYRDEEGYIRITDRLKDVIKIGGEWISSLELESALSQHPAVKEVAVVGRSDPKWQERPHAEVVLKEDQAGKVTEKDLLRFLHEFIDRGTIHKRAILTEIQLVSSIPRTSVGKIDKKRMRQGLQNR